MLLTTWHHATLPRQPELKHNERDGYRATGRGDTGSVLLWLGDRTKGAPFWCRPGWRCSNTSGQVSRDSTLGSRQMKKSLSKPAISQVSPPQQQGRAGWGAARRKGQVRWKCVPHLSPNTEEEERALSSSSLQQCSSQTHFIRLTNLYQIYT